MKTSKKSFLAILFLISLTSAALAYMGLDHSPGAAATTSGTATDGRIALQTVLPKGKVLKGSDGTISLALTLSASDLAPRQEQDSQPVDLVIVLDRSGSMNGQKIRDARNAVISLIEQLDAQDRLAVVTYANGVEVLSPLVRLDNRTRRTLKNLVTGINPGGGTNLGGGLENGIATLTRLDREQRQRKVILISDGLANHGITDPRALGEMASRATEHDLAITTIGVGYDFNEVLMTSIADHGSGQYYFLEHPETIGEVLDREFDAARNVMAGNLDLEIPLEDGVRLIDAGGYPIRKAGNAARIRIGNLLAGQERKIYLTYGVPTDSEGTISLGNIQATYVHDGVTHHISSPETMQIACVRDPRAVLASIDKAAWSDQVIKEDYGKLKESVADAIRAGKKDEALQVIEDYEARTQSINASVASEAVGENLEQDVQQLRKSVESTFTGAPAAVAEKKKQQAKALQYEGYQSRRDKQN